MASPTKPEHVVRKAEFDAGLSVILDAIKDLGGETAPCELPHGNANIEIVPFSYLNGKLTVTKQTSTQFRISISNVEEMENIIFIVLPLRMSNSTVQNTWFSISKSGYVSPFAAIPCNLNFGYTYGANNTAIAVGGRVNTGTLGTDQIITTTINSSHASFSVAPASLATGGSVTIIRLLQESEKA